MFRYTVYGSVALVITTVTLWAGTHVWVEYIELGRAFPLQPDALGWDNEETSWSGGHAGGGTDTRLPWAVRNGIRAAYVAQHYGGGPLPSPIGQGKHAGGQLIASQRESIQVPDAGYITAERNLVHALLAISKKGTQLPDRAVLELEERLAGVRERLAGSVGLAEARRGWERIWSCLIAAPDFKTASWCQQAAIRAARKSGDVAYRIGSETLVKGPLQQAEFAKAERMLLWSAAQALGLPVSDASPKGASTSRPSEITVILSSLPSAIERLAPEAQRNLFSSLSSLITLYSAQANLTTALSISEAARQVLSSPSVRSERLPNQLHAAWLHSRYSSTSAYSAEIKRALKQPEVESLDLLKSSIVKSEQASKIASETGLLSPRTIPGFFRTALLGSSSDKEAERLRKRVQEVEKEARLAGSNASYLTGLIHELGARKEKLADWCLGDSEALRQYQAAMKFAAGGSEPELVKGEIALAGEQVDEWRKAYNGYQRCVLCCAA